MILPQDIAPQLKALAVEIGAKQAWSISPHWMTKLAASLVILVVTILLSRFAVRACKAMAWKFAPSEADRTLPEFVGQIARWLILAIGLVAILNQIGLETASFLTVLGAASLSIGLALQGTLGNVAAGLMMLLNKPFRIGDTIKFEDIHGKVHRLGIFTTEIDTFNGVRTFIPNAKLFGGTVKNISTNGAIRMELLLTLPFGEDIEAAIKKARDIVSQQPKLLREPAPSVGAYDFSEKGVVVRVLAWAKPADFLSARSDIIAALSTNVLAAKVVE